MALPYSEDTQHFGKTTKPCILILEVKKRDSPHGDALAWLLVERKEIYQYDSKKAIYRASINLHYKKIKTACLCQNSCMGQFAGSYLHVSNSVSLTSGSVFLDLPGLEGQRIGTYLMNEIIQWAKQHWPEASVDSIKLLAGQADVENKARRNWFYEQFGLVFDYREPEHRSGQSRSIRVGELKTIETWKQNITEHRVIEYISEILEEKRNSAQELEGYKQKYERLLSQRKRAERCPLRWALKQLYCCYYDKILVGLWLCSIVVSVLWFVMKI